MMNSPCLRDLRHMGAQMSIRFICRGISGAWVQKRWDIYMKWILRKLMDLTICMNRKAS